MEVCWGQGGIPFLSHDRSSCGIPPTLPLMSAEVLGRREPEGGPQSGILFPGPTQLHPTSNPHLPGNLQSPFQSLTAAVVGTVSISQDIRLQAQPLVNALSMA